MIRLATIGAVPLRDKQGQARHTHTHKSVIPFPKSFLRIDSVTLAETNKTIPVVL